MSCANAACCAVAPIACMHHVKPITLRTTKAVSFLMQREERRVLGLVILRGEEVVSLVLEGPPPAEEQLPLNAKNAEAGSGLAKAVGRGMAPPGQQGGPASGLAGPARGVGGPAPGMMLPRPNVRAFAVFSVSVWSACVANAAGVWHTAARSRSSVLWQHGRAGSEVVLWCSCNSSIPERCVHARAQPLSLKNVASCLQMAAPPSARPPPGGPPAARPGMPPPGGMPPGPPRPGMLPPGYGAPRPGMPPPGYRPPQ